MAKLKTIDWDVRVSVNEADYSLAKQVAKRHNLSLTDVLRILSVNIITVPCLSVICGYNDPQHIRKMIERGSLTCCYPFSIPEIRVRKHQPNKLNGFVFVKLDSDCVELIKRRVG